MVSMCRALAQIKDDPFSVLHPSAVEQVCREQGHEWRDGPLKPARTVACFVQQVAAGNVPCSEVKHLAGTAFSESAYCQARQRLPLRVLQELGRRVQHSGMEMAGDDSRYRWRGHRTWIIDGSTFSMPDTPELQAHFGQPKAQAEGCGFPTAHLLALFDAGTGLLAEPTASPLYSSDLAGCRAMHAQMEAGDLLLGDDSFSTYGHFALLGQAGVHAVMPNHHKRIVSFRPGRRHARPGQKGAGGLPRSRFIRRLGKQDQLVEWFKPPRCPKWMSPADYAQLPDSIVVREVRRTVRRKGFRPITVTIVTTLLDPLLYPAEELIELRLSRWRVETDLKHLKTTMKLEVLRCQSVAGIEKELAVFGLVYNLVRCVMMEAAERQGVSPERISFADALQWLRHADPDDELPKLEVVPLRPNRWEPRVKKRRPKPFDLMNKPRAKLRRELRTRKHPKNRAKMR